MPQANIISSTSLSATGARIAIDAAEREASKLGKALRIAASGDTVETDVQVAEAGVRAALEGL
jgi:uncharacterized protein GlcG (DUF336 family)